MLAGREGRRLGKEGRKRLDRRIRLRGSDKELVLVAGTHNPLFSAMMPPPAGLNISMPTGDFSVLALALARSLSRPSPPPSSSILFFHGFTVFYCPTFSIQAALPSSYFLSPGRFVLLALPPCYVTPRRGGGTAAARSWEIIHRIFSSDFFPRK